VNTHHEDWADNEAAFPAALPRLDAIWAQVAAEFAGYGRGDLVFELFNEPSNLTVGQLNTMNAKLLATVRKTNPDRQVHLGGLVGPSSPPPLLRSSAPPLLRSSILVLKRNFDERVLIVRHRCYATVMPL